MLRGDGLFVRLDGDHHDTVGRYLRCEMIGLIPGFFVGPEVMNRSPQGGWIANIGPADSDGEGAGAAIEENDCPAAVSERPGPDLDVPILCDAAAGLGGGMLGDSDNGAIEQDRCGIV